MDILPVGEDPVGCFVQRLSCVSQIGRAVDQKTVAGGRAERVDHDQSALRIFFAQRLRREHGVLHGGCHAGAKGNVQHIALLQKIVKKRLILKFIQLRRGRQLAFGKKAVEFRQRLRVAAHVVFIVDAVDLIRIEQDREIALVGIGIGEIDRGFAGQQEGRFHKNTSLPQCGS